MSVFPVSLYEWSVKIQYAMPALAWRTEVAEQLHMRTHHVLNNTRYIRSLGVRDWGGGGRAGAYVVRTCHACSGVPRTVQADKLHTNPQDILNDLQGIT